MRAACLPSLTFLLVVCAMPPAHAEVQVWVPDALQKILPDTRPTPIRRMRADLIAARGEYESVQVALRADEQIEGVTAEVTPLVGPAGTIGDEQLTLNIVGLIPVEKNTPATPEDELILAPCEIPDPLLPYEPLDLEPDRTRALWLTVHVPRDTEPGDYRGAITIRAGRETVVPIKLTVHPVTLPDKRPLHMTNWFHGHTIPNWYDVTPWSEEHWELIEAYARDMAEHGQDTILVGMGLIDRWQEQDGTLTFDFDRFDRYVDTFMAAGVNQGIELGHVGTRGPGGWDTTEMIFHDWRVYVGEDVEAEGLTHEEKVRALVRATQDHLRERGLLDISMIHIADEPIPGNLEAWKRLSRIVHDAAPDLRRVDAIHVPDCDGELEIYCPELGYFDQWYDNFARMQDAGEIELWFYTCCHPTGLYANRFLDYKLIKTRLLHWMNYAYDARGYLHWGLNYWTDKPYEEAARGDLPPGDAWIVYPGEAGPVSSIRWEALRDGVEDFELLWLLEQEQKSLARELGLPADAIDPTGASKCIVREIVRTLTDYTKSAVSLRAARAKVFAAILDTARSPRIVASVEPHPLRSVAPGPVTITGAAEQGTTITVNGQPLLPGPGGKFQGEVVISRDEPAIVLVASLGGESKRLTWTWRWDAD